MADKPEKAEEMLNALLASMGEAVLIVEPDGRTIRNCNAAAEKLFGYDRDELIGAKTEILHIDREHYEKFGQIGEPILEEKGVFRIEYQMKQKDGTIIDTYNTVTPIKEKLGWEAGVISIIRDITDQKETERKLKNEKNRLEEAQRIGQLGDWYYNVITEEISWMPTMFDIYERDPAKGSPTYSEVREYYQDHVDFHEKMVERAIWDNEPYSFDIQIRSEKGNRKYVHVEGKPQVNDKGEVVKLYGTVQDITKRKEVEVALEQQQKELQSLLGSLPGMAYKCKNNRNYTMQFVSQGCKPLTGYEPVEIQEDNEIAYGRLIHPDDRDKVWKAVQEALEEDEHFEVEYRIQTRSGRKKWVWERGAGLDFEDEDEIILQGFISDITHRKKQEQRLQELLEQKNTLLQEIHHRVKNNMAIVSGLLELQKHQLEDKKTIEALNRSQLRLYTMAAVHERLYQENDLTDISSNDYLKKLLELQKDFYSGSDVEIESHIDSFRLNVNQAIPLGLLLNELITNAYQHAFKDNSEGNIAVSLHLKGDQIHAEVKDDGEGMEEQIDVDAPESLGFTIIKTLKEQLAATMDVDTSSDGTSVNLMFQREEPKGSTSSHIDNTFDV